MMNNTDISLVVVSFVLFLSAPYLPSSFYITAFSNLLVPFLLLVALIASMSYSRFGAVTLFLAIVSLFVEYRRRVFIKEPTETTYAQQMQSAPPLVANEVHPPALQPAQKSVSFAPEEDSSNEFAAVGRSINGKQVLNSNATAHGSFKSEKFLIEQGFAPML